MKQRSTVSADDSINPYAFAEAQSDPRDDAAFLAPEVSPTYLYVLAGLTVVMGLWGMFANGLGLAVGLTHLIIMANFEADATWSRVNGVEVSEGVGTALLIVGYVLMGLNLLMSIAILVAGVGLFTRKEQARRAALVVILACGAVTFVEFAIWIGNTIWQVSIMSDGGAVPFAQGNDAGFASFLAIVVIGIAMQLAFYLVEYAFYAVTFLYLRSAAARALFARPAGG